MSDFDFFYEEDYELNEQVRINQYSNSKIYTIYLIEHKCEFTVNFTRKKYKQINDIAIFPKCYTLELYDYIVSQLARKAGVPLKLVKHSFIYEQ